MFHSIRTRVIATFAVVLAVAVAVVVVGSLVYVRWQVQSLSDEEGLSSARACASLGEFLLHDLEEVAPDSQEYAEDRSVLRGICRESNMDYLYLYRCDVDNGEIIYLMCVADDDASDERVARERGYGTVVDWTPDENELRALAGEDVLEPLLLNNEFGEMFAWFCVVPNTDGKVLAGADFSVSERRTRVFNTTTILLTPLVVALLVVMIVQLRVLQRRVFKPLRVIADRMHAFSAETASNFEPLGIGSQDEMGDIADAFEGMAADIDAYMSDIERLTAERVQADVELNVARHIQLGMVPERCELAGASFEANAFARAARACGGDFYDVYELEDGRIACAVGDASGKGVAAALFMAMTMTMLHGELASGISPAKALNRVNERLCASNPEGMFVTAFAFVFDPATGEVRYANAGHLPPLVVGHGGVRQIDAKPGILLGLFEDADLEGGVLSLEEGEYLLTFTDGATEAVNAKKEFLGDAALMKRIDAGAPYCSASAVVDAAVDAVDSFAAGSEQHDDLTIVVLRRTASEPASELRALPVELASFGAVRDEILAHSADEAAGRKACLACEEAFVNIVSHSGATNVWFAVESDGDQLKVTLADDGTPFDPLASGPANRAFDELDSGGMGISLICSLAAHVSYTRTTRNVLTLVF